MEPKRGLAVVLGAVFAVALLTGAVVPGDAGVASASHDPEDGNYTVVPMGDRSPGAENVRYGQRVVAKAGVDLETLEETTATYEEGSWTKCGPQDGETFGIDRGSTRAGYEVDESLQENVKTFSAGEDVFRVEFNGEDDFGASTNLDDGDEFISVAKCIDNPDEPGWYRISGTTTGVTESGERVTFGSQSHYFYICECDSEAEAREKLGPPPSEPQGTPTPTSAPDSGGSGSDGSNGSTTEGTADSESSENTATDDGEADATDTDDGPAERQSQPPSDGGTEGTASGDGAGSSGGSASTSTANGAEAGGAGGDGTATTPTENWDERVLQTPTAAEGPGFGPVPAVLALLGAVLLVRRRR